MQSKTEHWWLNIHSIDVVLHQAVIYSYTFRPECVKLRDNEQFTPLLIASCFANPDVVEELLSKGADITATEQQEKSVLHLAAEHNQTEVIRVCFFTIRVCYPI